MVSKWYRLKEAAIKLRGQGKSIRDIEAKLGIPRSTLSGWLKHIILTDTQRNYLKNKVYKSLIASREKALLWHHSQKTSRINIAENEALNTMRQIDINDKTILELALSFLYLGEGAKTKVTSLGNTNPLILKFFISAVNKVFNNPKTGKFELHLRSDQNEANEIQYWSSELNVPKNNFTFIKDKRIAKSPTYPEYHGVCVARFSEISIQRRLVFLSHKFCNIIANTDD